LPREVVEGTSSYYYGGEPAGGILEVEAMAGTIFRDNVGFNEKKNTGYKAAARYDTTGGKR
jgi:hypothetical protein